MHILQCLYYIQYDDTDTYVTYVCNTNMFVCGMACIFLHLQQDKSEMYVLKDTYTYKHAGLLIIAADGSLVLVIDLSS